MKVKAKVLGEHPIGVWREPGQEFEFDGEKPAMWMEPLEKVKETKAKGKKPAEDKKEDSKSEDGKSDEDKKSEDESNDGKEDKAEFTFKHRGRGKYDVYDPEGNVIGDNLVKEEAQKLVDEKNSEGQK